MTRGQAKRHDRICMRILLVVAAVMLLHMTASTIRGNQRQQEKTKQEQHETDEEFMVEETKKIHERGQQTESEVLAEEKFAVFDTMSSDWGIEDIEGFVYYQIPEEYTIYGGYFPEKMQIYTYCLCKQYGVRYSLVVAMIEQESGYRFDKTGDDGNSKGYMQIYESAHTDRIERLGCKDLLNPYQNVHIGIDYFAELLEKYETEQDALAAYNYGEAGAKRNLWNKGVYVYAYNKTIMQRASEIEEVRE